MRGGKASPQKSPRSPIPEKPKEAVKTEKPKETVKKEPFIPKRDFQKYI